MLQVTSQLGNSQMRLDSEKNLTHSHKAHPWPDLVPCLSLLEIATAVETVSFYTCVQRP
jgi:hypothetical protein